MWKLLVEGIEVQFSDFTKELQEKLYLNNKEEFQEDAANSQYEDIRRLLIEDNQTTDEILKQILDIEMGKQGFFYNMMPILKHPNFKEDKAIFDKLSQSKNWETRKITAMASNSSEFLNEMLLNELDGDNNEDVKKAILDNPSFKTDEVTIGKLAQSEDWRKRKIAARLSNSSEFLNEMFQNELSRFGRQRLNAISYILNNPSFKANEVTFNKIRQSQNFERWQIARERNKSSEFSNKMLQNELDGDTGTNVVCTILDDPSFKPDKVNLDKLLQSEDWIKKEIAIHVKTSELLNEMLRNELNRDNDGYIEELILDNSSFKPDEVTIDKLAQSANWKRRKKAAQLSNSLEFLNKMLQNELDGDNDENVKDAIYVAKQRLKTIS